MIVSAYQTPFLCSRLMASLFLLHIVILRAVEHFVFNIWTHCSSNFILVYSHEHLYNLNALASSIHITSTSIFFPLRVLGIMYTSICIYQMHYFQREISIKYLFSLISFNIFFIINAHLVDMFWLTWMCATLLGIESTVNIFGGSLELYIVKKIKKKWVCSFGHAW